MRYIARFRNSGNVEVGGEMEIPPITPTTKICELLEENRKQMVVGFDDKVMVQRSLVKNSVKSSLRYRYRS